MKWLRRILILSLVIFLGACGANEAGGKDSGDGSVNLRISWWGGDNRHEDTLAAIRAFEEKYPHISVQPEFSGWNGIFDKMTTQLGGGTEPDVMQVNYNWLISFSSDGTGFYDLNELSHIVSLDGYDSEFLEFGKMNGILNAVPHGKNAFSIAINKTIWDSFGADIPKTWDDFFTAAEKFPEGQYPLLPPEPIQFFFVASYLAQKTGLTMFDDEGNINFSVDELEEGLLWYQSLIDGGVIPDRKTMLEYGGNELFDGSVAGVMNWTGGFEETARNLEEINQELYVLQDFPMISDAVSTGVFTKPTMLFAISKNTPHPEEAALLLDYLINDPDGIRLMGTTRGVPAVESALEILTEDGQMTEVSTAAYEFTRDVEGVEIGQLLEMDALREIYDNIFEGFELGQLSAREAAEQLHLQIGEAIQRLLK